MESKYTFSVIQQNFEDFKWGSGAHTESLYDGPSLKEALRIAYHRDWYAGVVELDCDTLICYTDGGIYIDEQACKRYGIDIPVACTIEAGLLLRKKYHLKDDEQLPEEAWSDPIYLDAVQGIMPEEESV